MNQQIDEQRVDYKKVQKALTDEIFRMAGLNPNGTIRKIFSPLLWLPTKNFSKIIVDYDSAVKDFGLARASGKFLDKFANGSESTGSESIPVEGPLIITSNHPGTFDFFTIMSNLPRDDIKFIISGVPVVRTLPTLSRYFIYTESDPHGRMNVVRESINHVKDGGCLVLYPTGILDPDPEVMDGAFLALNKWSRSIELILRRTPDSQLQIAIVSGVVLGSTMKSPITRFAKEEWKKQRLAEYMLVARQVISGVKIDVVPKVSFGNPFLVEQYQDISIGRTITEDIIDMAKKQLSTHMSIFPCVEQTRA